VGQDAASPSMDWARKYTRNLEGFKLKNCQSIDAVRVENTSVKHIRDWFKAAEETLKPQTVRKELTFNMDETMVDDSKNGVKVIVPSNALPLRIDQHDSDGFHITLVFCVGADGKSMKCSLILPLAEFPLNLEAFADKFHWAGQSSGWITEEIFYSWVTEAFIPHVNRRRVELKAENERAILFIDSHESRRSPRALEALKAANIDTYTFSSHSTHVAQPLDLGINRSFKTKLRAARSEGPSNTVAERRIRLLKKCARACHEALYDETIIKAWEKSGLSPWNVETTLKSEYVIEEVPPEIAKAGMKRKRSKISLTERLLTDQNLINELKNKKEEKEKPKRPRGRPPKKLAKMNELEESWDSSQSDSD